MMFPVAISVGTHDRILKLPYIWYGPELPWIRFRGRPLSEWTALLVALPIMWPTLDAVIWLASVSHLMGRTFEGVGWAVVHIGGTWLASSALAGLFYRRLINTDRDGAWIAQTAWFEIHRVAYAYGPIDRGAVYATAPLWLLLAWALTTTNLPFPVDLVVAAALTWPVGCWTASKFQSPLRAMRLANERALRRGPTATVHLTGRTDLEAAEAA